MTHYFLDGLPAWRRFWLALPLLVLFAPAVRADYVDDWGPALGSRIPPLEVSDQDGNLRTLADLSGANGLLLFLNRSADW